MQHNVLKYHKNIIKNSFVYHKIHKFIKTINVINLQGFDSIESIFYSDNLKFINNLSIRNIYNPNENIDLSEEEEKPIRRARSLL